MMSKKIKNFIQPSSSQNTTVIESSLEPLPWYCYVIPPTILAGITFLFYFPSRHYDFQFDDIANITKYYDIRHTRFWDLFFTGPRWICRWLNSLHYSAGKFDPYYYRMGNIIQHILIGMIIFFFLLLALRHLKKKSFFKDNAFQIATLTAVLFLLHPVQTQTVSYVIQGKLEGVATFFILSMAICFWVAFTVKSPSVAVFLQIIYFALAAIACGSKEIAIMSPLLIVLIDWFFVAQGCWKQMVRRWTFHLSSFLTVFGLYFYFLKPEYFTAILSFAHRVPNNLGNVITETPLQQITPWSYCISEFKVILHYLWIFIWPFNMSVEYDWVLSKGLLAPDSFFPLLALSIIGYLVYRLLAKNKVNLIAFGLLWFMICIAPRSSIIPSAELIVDYKTYAASFGWLFVLSCGFVWLAIYGLALIPRVRHAYRPIIQGTMAVIFLIGLGFATMDRNTVWRSGLDFWGNMLKNAPGKARIYNNYGVELSQKLQKYQESVFYFKQAIAMDKYYPDPHNNLAVVYAYLNKLDDAIREMKEGLRINPNYAEGYNNLAAFYLNKKEYESAEKCLNMALKIRPCYGKAFFNRARIYLEQGKNDQALADLKNACTRADLDNNFGFSVYGKFALDHRYFDDAIFAFSKLIELEPKNIEGYFNLGNAYHMSGKYEIAIKCYEQSLALAPGDMRCMVNIAETYVKLNDLNNALLYFEKIDLKKAPQVAIRIADCYEKLGNIEKSKKTLENLIIMRIPQTLKDNAQIALANLGKKSTCI